MEIKDIILNFRKENKISQREFARRCELSNSLISVLEMGINPQTGKKNSPDLITYKKLASGMGITLQDLLDMLDDSEVISLRSSDIGDTIEYSKKQKDPEISIVSGMMETMTKEQKQQVIDLIRVLIRKG